MHARLAHRLETRRLPSWCRNTNESLLAIVTVSCLASNPTLASSLSSMHIICYKIFMIHLKIKKNNHIATVSKEHRAPSRNCRDDGGIVGNIYTRGVGLIRFFFFVFSILCIFTVDLPSPRKHFLIPQTKSTQKW